MFTHIRYAASLTVIAIFAAQGAAAAGTCDVTWRLDNNPGPIGVLTWSTSYGQAGGGIKGSGESADCVSLVSGLSTATFLDVEASTIVTISYNAIPNGFSGPTDLARCTFEPTGAAPSVSDFVIQVPVTAVGTGFPPPFLQASVRVSDVSCTGIVTTTSSTVTTTSTTMTTLPPPACGDPNDDGITAVDALFILQVAVGTNECDPCVCAVSGQQFVTATDALIVLNAAVGKNVTLMCPACR